MLVIAILLGGAVGAALAGGVGLLTGALLGWLVARSVLQGREIVALRQALAPATRVAVQASAAIEPAAEALAAEAGLSAPRSAAPLASTFPARPVEPLAPDPFFDPAGPALPAPSATATAAADRRLAPPAARPGADLLAPLKAWLFGGNTIVKVGVGILFIGLAFLAKFASEHVQLPVELRLAGIGGVALVLLAIGWRLRLRRAAYAQVLQGGAVAVLYLTLFVAFRFYGVLAVGPVFALMAAVAALAAGLAVLQDARALAVVGALGGFAAPLLVSTGGGEPAALFGYYLVLDLGIAAVAWYRTWRGLNLIGFVGTFGVAGAWGALHYDASRYAMSQGFLVAYFLVFIAILLLPARRAAAPTAGAAPQRSDAWLQGSLLFGLPTAVFALEHDLVREQLYGAALAALALGAFYVALALALRGRPRLAGVFEASLAIATVFLTLVIPFALDPRSTAGAWALEGAGLVWLGFRQARRLARGFGYALLLLAGVSMGVAMQHQGALVQLANPVLFNALLAGAASLAAALFVRRHGVDPIEARAEPVLIAWALLWLIGAAALHIDTLVSERHAGAAWLGVASALALGCTALALRLDWPRIAQVAIGHAPVMLLVVAAPASVYDGPWRGGGGWGWPVALATHLALLAWAAPRWPVGARAPVHVAGVMVLAILGALSGRALTAGWGEPASAWPWLGWMAVPALLLMLLPRPAVARHWPVRAAPRAYRGVGAGLLAAGALLWSVVANFGSDGDARPLPHLPLLNPLDLGVGIALLGAALWLRSAAARELLTDRAARIATAALAAAGFVWLNAILVRAFHHYAGVPYRLHAWTASLAVQTGLTLLWSATALALMWFAARRAARVPWGVGAALLAAVVVKLMAVDLAGSGSVTRIVSFIGVGALMLVIGYVAPPPPREATHAVA